MCFKGLYSRGIIQGVGGRWMYFKGLYSRGIIQGVGGVVDRCVLKVSTVGL